MESSTLQNVRIDVVDGYLWTVPLLALNLHPPVLPPNASWLLLARAWLENISPVQEKGTGEGAFEVPDVPSAGPPWPMDQVAVHARRPALPDLPVLRRRLCVHRRLHCLLDLCARTRFWEGTVGWVEEASFQVRHCLGVLGLRENGRHEGQASWERCGLYRVFGARLQGTAAR